MKKIILTLLSCGFMFAQEPPKADPKPPETILLSQAERQKLGDLTKEYQSAKDKFDLTSRSLNAEYEGIRLGACLRAGVKAEQCGSLDMNGTLVKLPLPAPPPVPKDEKAKDSK